MTMRVPKAPAQSLPLAVVIESLPGPPLFCPVFLLATSHDQRRENGLIEDEEHQQYEPRNDSPCKHEYHAHGDKERPEEGIEAHAKR